MKKVFSFLAVLAFVAMASSAWAAQQTIGQPKKAYASFATQELTFNVTLHNWASGTP